MFSGVRHQSFYFTPLAESGKTAGSTVDLTTGTTHINDTKLAWDGQQFGLLWVEDTAPIVLWRLSPSGSMLGQTYPGPNAVMSGLQLLPRPGGGFYGSWIEYLDSTNPNAMDAVVAEIGPDGKAIQHVFVTNDRDASQEAQPFLAHTPAGFFLSYAKSLSGYFWDGVLTLKLDASFNVLASNELVPSFGTCRSTNVSTCGYYPSESLPYSSVALPWCALEPPLYTPVSTTFGMAAADTNVLTTWTSTVQVSGNYAYIAYGQMTHW
jgi:hypothetical protein